MAPSSSSFSIPNVLSTGYDPFAEYETQVSASYGSDSYPPPPPHSSVLGHHQHSLTDSPGRSPGPSSSRSSLSYAQVAHSSSSLGPRIKMENANEYGSGIDASHYASPRLMQAPYMTESSTYGNLHQHYLSDNQSPSWSKVEYGVEQYYQNSPTGEPAPVSRESKRADDGKHNRPKRAPRKMTSFADAQYQCQVAGCGKLFSRSYNYKAHLDTHDDKREYPFPCPVADCNKRHMDDGCSKRFDVGTCDLRVEGLGGIAPVNRSMGGSTHPMGPGSGPLPPINAPMGGGSSLLHPETSACRSRSVLSGASDGTHGDSWQR
ncbi:hypothetical protein CSIM01_13820 [Colletotrichum simmondsii]|uniref:C2H2-type domain-containing protein n=1 Tax=Colletotrichum simmondsii TaxID=703756 RepID=A0A135TTC0_9PEZI|nr:hypothetical protein CSIM01_13820 [Colletotrichum simmondsii]